MNGDSSLKRFIVTTPGLSATRWLSFVIGSHPDAFVAHGHFPLESVVRSRFLDEKSKDDTASLSTGIEAAQFYRTRAVDEVFARYRELKPNARACGNIHSYTLSSLMASIRGVDELRDIRIVNLLRHPVTFIDSHCSLVRSSERHPELYRHYVENVFVEAVWKFPELLLVDCPDYREFLAFATSCLSVFNMLNDFSYDGFQHVRMESLISDVRELKRFSEELTGLTYSEEHLLQFVREGAINRHRKGRASTDPRTVYDSWSSWKRDIACLMIPDELLDHFEQKGYNVGILRESASGDHPELTAPCLADRLRNMDSRHPLLTSVGAAPRGTATAAAVPQLLESFRGYNLVQYGAQIFALASTLGPTDLATLSDETLIEYQRNGSCFIGDSVQEVKESVTRSTQSCSPDASPPPRLLDEHRGFNLVVFRGSIYGLRQSIGEIDLSRNIESLMTQHGEEDVVIAPTLEDAKARIDHIESPAAR